ncbi:MAG: type III-B CRISPR module RAMP protein Cmr6 [Candidatus Rokubacteria bacterium]|nr:type III-B CRISPR module RAMP protein Cmr6 [Candidatus Rokubacteria bacterium]
MKVPQIRRQISPGFYFQRCLQIWQPDLRQIDKQQKASAMAPLEGRNGQAITGDAALHAALLARQAAAFAGLRDRFPGIGWRLQSLTPFVTGIGQPHPLENGFAFLKPYGLPYLAASGVKGAVRAACLSVWRERHGSDAEAVRRLSKHYFGSEDKEIERGRAVEHTRGALVFFDLLPEPPAAGKKPLFRLDVVNPHYANYYGGQKGDVPADWYSPVPTYFLTLRDDLAWTLRVIYAPVRPQDARPDWLGEVGPGIERALTEGGLGAKKTWGYGLFALRREEEIQGEAVGAGPDRAAALQSRPPATPPVATPAQEKTTSARAAEDVIRTLRANDVRSRLSAIEQYVRGASPEERPVLLDLLDRRLHELGLKNREVAEMLQRVRTRINPPADSNA